MNRLDEFCKEWELKINVEKAEFVIFNRPRRYHVPTFNMGSFTIELDTQYKYLGIIIIFSKWRSQACRHNSGKPNK